MLVNIFKIDVNETTPSENSEGVVMLCYAMVRGALSIAYLIKVSPYQRAY